MAVLYVLLYRAAAVTNIDYTLRVAIRHIRADLSEVNLKNLIAAIIMQTSIISLNK